MANGRLEQDRLSGAPGSGQIPRARDEIDPFNEPAQLVVPSHDHDLTAAREMSSAPPLPGRRTFGSSGSPM